MEIVFTYHARDQLAEREISEEEVRKAIIAPDRVVPEEDRTVFQKMINSHGRQFLIRVITITDKSIVRVLTAYQTSKIYKYL